MLKLSARQLAEAQNTADWRVYRQVARKLIQDRPDLVGHLTSEQLEAECHAALTKALAMGLDRGPAAYVFILSRFVPADQLQGKASSLSRFTPQQPPDRKLTDQAKRLVQDFSPRQPS